MDDTPDRDEHPENGKHEVLEVFGLKLRVSNPRIAELLTMSAKDAMTTDVRQLFGSSDARSTREDVAQALPDVAVAPTTPHDEIAAHDRKVFRQGVDSVGAALGFATRPDGLWSSPTGVAILTRVVDQPLSLAAAAHYVAEVAARRESAAGPESSALFVVDRTQSADVFKVAIRQRHLYDDLRVITLDGLQQISALLHANKLDHRKVVVLLAPIAGIDVAEVLSVISSEVEQLPPEAL